ncbi:MAG: hypothetical protein GY710_27365 [Desulfobacteraceae bacterium]|nr:hypothetical protein [Desulfobacteraceae bacterium]
MFLPQHECETQIDYDELIFEKDIKFLEKIDEYLENNPFVNHNPEIVIELKEEVKTAYAASVFEKKIRNIIGDEKKNVDDNLKTENIELQSKKQSLEKLLILIKSYSKALVQFNDTVEEISEYAIKCESQEVLSMGHKLFIENQFKLNKEKFLEVINHFLKTNSKILKFGNLKPENLFEENFKKQSPKVHDYDDFENKINSKFEELNKKSYKIITTDGRKFESLSAGWKTSVILDLVLGYEGDLAPLIIDQPEDNLATNYINRGLITAIKKIKSKKQILLVSHNATIPMLGDAQNVVLCETQEGKINIRSNRLEGKLDGKNIVDYIAKITDGGKSSIKKRVKKYNLKQFKD